MASPRNLKRRVGFIATLAVALLIAGLVIAPVRRRVFHPLIVRILGPATVEDRLETYGPAARERMRPAFAQAGIAYPPQRVVLVGLKQERQLQLYAADADGAMRFIHSYPVLAASGDLGPKLREGDRQVPEGIYKIESLNPNSRYHLSLRVSYPNDEDRRIASEDGRDNLGGDIFIHGKAVSVGCLAMGDDVAEELFVLVADTGLDRTEVLLCPLDLRTSRPIEKAKPWKELYATLQLRLQELPEPAPH